jgi:hypothetical protein
MVEVQMRTSREKNREAEIRQRLEDFLDAGYGSCVLRELDAPAVVQPFVRQQVRLLGIFSV